MKSFKQKLAYLFLSILLLNSNTTKTNRPSNAFSPTELTALMAVPFATLAFILIIQKGENLARAAALISKPQFPDYLILNPEHQELVDRACSCIENKIPIPGGGVFLYGPPGNGKTAIINYIAFKSNAVIMPISPANVCRVPMGNMPPDFPSNLKGLFSTAELYYSLTGTPVVLLFDEADFLCTRRDKVSEMQSKCLAAQFLMEASYAAEKQGLYLFAASNYLEIIDTATLRDGRIGEKILFENPKEDEIKVMFTNILKKYSEASFTTKEINPLAKQAFESDLSRAGVAEALKRAGSSFFVKNLKNELKFDSPNIAERFITLFLSYFKEPENNSMVAMKKILEKVTDDNKKLFLKELELGIKGAKASQDVVTNIRKLQLKQDNLSLADINVKSSILA